MSKENEYLEKLQLETRKMLADMAHDVENQKHWVENQKHRVEYRKHLLENQKHWDVQQKHWKWLYWAGIIAIFLNAFKSLWE